MIIKKEKYCIASKTFPLKFFMFGVEHDSIDDSLLLVSKEECEEELKTYDEPEECQILKVVVTYEI